MRTPVCSASLALVLLAPVALALPPSAQKRLEDRAQVDEALRQLLGGASVPATISRLHYIGQPEYAAEELTQALRREVEVRQRRDLAAVLASLGARDAEPTLVRLARDEDSAVRMYAAQGLGRLHSRRVEALMPLLEDKSSGVRKEAARALGASGTASVGKALVAAARQEEDLEVRAALLVAAGEAGDARQAPALKAFLSNDSESTRFAAAKGLCRLGSPDGFAFAHKLLGSRDRFVRRQGLELYEGVPAKRAESALRPLLQGEDRALAAGAARVLYQGGDKKMLEWLVLASWYAQGDEKLAYESELEPLHLADDQRKAILRKAGVAP